VASVNILKRIKVGGRWKFFAIPHTEKGGPDWKALPEGRYYLEWYLAGKRRRTWAGHTVSQVLESQRRKHHELEGRELKAAGFDNAGEETRKPPLHLAVAKYLEQIETIKKPNTHRKYRAVLERFLEYFKLRPNVESVSTEDLNQFIVDLIRKDHMSANTVIHNLIIIAQFFRRHGRLNITKELELPERITSLPKEYTEEQLVRFFAVCAPAEKTLFTAFLMTGLREQEMVHLFWSDVNARLRSIRVTSKPKYGFSPKRWEEREVPVPIQLIELLADHPRRETSELVFPSRMGNREQNMLLRCKEVATRAGLDAAKFDIKTFRSTYATRMLRTGFDVRTVQHWMGHKSLETTMRYLVPATEVHDRLDRVLLPGTIPERKGPTAAEGPKLLEGRPPAKQSRRR
jgi:site-specific recombinase XerD